MPLLVLKQIHGKVILPINEVSENTFKSIILIRQRLFILKKKDFNTISTLKRNRTKYQSPSF